MERLVIDSGAHTFTADFHPELTVIGGLDRAAREALAGEVIDSLAGARPGVHLELETGGRELTVFRPAGGKHRVVDTGAVVDVTNEHLGSDGSIDLFASLGVDRSLARRTMRLTPDDLVVRGAQDETVSRLAAVDQRDLWRAAEHLRATEAALDKVSEDSGTSATDIALVDAVEAQHAKLVDATETYERIRLISLTIGDIGAIAGLALAFTEGIAIAVPFLLLALAGAALGFFYRHEVTVATDAERKVLTAAGASDYASFHLERVSALLDGDQERRQFMQAVSTHRHALEDWEALAGDIPVATALSLRAQVEASAGVRNGVDALRHLSETAPTMSDDVSSELAQALLARVEGVRALTAGDESLPLVVDDPFTDLDPSVKPVLLELLAEAAGSPQLIVLTGDDDVRSWAEIEALTGRVAICEPTVKASMVSA